MLTQIVLPFVPIQTAGIQAVAWPRIIIQTAVPEIRIILACAMPLRGIFAVLKPPALMAVLAIPPAIPRSQPAAPVIATAQIIQIQMI